MKKYLLFESLSQSLSNKASNTQSFKVANKPGRSNGWKHLVLLFMFMVTMLGSYAQTSGVPYTTTGNGTWTCPAGVTSVTVQCWGGGGAGGGCAYASGTYSYEVGGGGAGGSYISYTVSVTPGNVYNFTVGAGGTGVAGTSTTAGNGNAGGSTYFGNTTAGSSAGASVLATGGAGGNGAMGLGISTNKVATNATAVSGSTSGNLPSSGYISNLAGGNGSAATGGTSPASGAGGTGANGGGAGGAAVSGFPGSTTAGAAGTAPGGGGSGANNKTAAGTGGAGGKGQIELTWSVGPTVNDPATFTATAASTSQINLAATANGNGNNIVVVYSTSNSFTAPTNGSAAPSSGSFAGGTVFYNGVASGLGNQTGLSSGTTYYYKAFSYDGSNNFSSGFAVNATTNTSVSDPATFTTTAVSSSQINFTATANGSSNNIVVVYNLTGTFGTPTGGSAAPSSGSYISGTVLYNGVASGFNGTSQSGLAESTTYYYKAFSYDGSNNFSGGFAANATTSSVAVPATFTATDDGTSPTTQIDLVATANASSNNIVVVYKTANTFTAPTNGTAAGIAGTSFAGGTIFYNGVASGLGNQSSLSPGTTYYYEAFSYDGANNFSVAATATATTTAGAPVITSIAPSSVFYNGNNGGAPPVITVTGSSFISTSVVQLNGSTTGVTTTYVDANHLTATITNATITALTSTSATISVYTSGGGTSSTTPLTISVTPQLTGIIPTAVAAGSSATTLTVYGNNFTSTSQITWNGTPLTTTYIAASSSGYYTAAHLTATIPSSSLTAIGATPVGVTQTQLSTTASSSTINFNVATVVVTNPSSPWSPPAGVTSAIVNVWGAGGGGGFGVDGHAAGGSGAGGSFVQSSVTVNPSNSYTITIGAGGTGGTGSGTGTANIPATITDGAAGGSSSFVGSTDGISILAVGGNGGLSTYATGTTSVPNNAAGGAAVSSGNTYTGGTLIESLYGSAGGTAAGSSWTSAAGNGANGGPGGAGAPTSTSNVGSAGNAPAGGGSGGHDQTGSYPTYINSGGAGAAGQVQVLYNLPSSVTNSTLTASAQVGSAATTYTITGSNIPTSFNATGLPPGLSINTSTGAITGTPTDASGSPYSVNISSSNGVSGGTTATLIYTITALPGITSSNTAAGKVGTAFSYSTTASNSPTSFTLASGNVPTGLTFHSDGTITGTPASGTFGIYPLSIYATNGSGDGPASTVTITIADVPTTSSIDPIDALAGGSSFTITVVGSHFVSGSSTVTWNGSSTGVSSVTVVDASHITALIDASLIASTYSGTTALVGVTTTGLTPSGTQSFIIDNLSTTITTAGNTTWTCPPGVTLITVKAWGGGGAGGGSNGSSYNLGGGGAGGSFVEYKTTVVPGTVYNLTVGAGGTAVSGSSGNAGSSSYFGNTIAGNPFGASILATGGAGGTGATGTNSSSNFGGGFAGGVGSASGNVPSSGAYYNFAGTSGQISVGGATAGAYAGAGGNGAGPGGSSSGGAGGAVLPASGSSTAGNNGSAPGGGGSGALGALTAKAGGNGGAGEISLIYNSAPIITSTTAASGTIGTAFTYTVTGLYTPTSYNATGLPSTLSINTSTGAINGTPTVSGDYTVTISATNGAGTGTATLLLTINNPSAPTITSATTATGTVGVYGSNLYEVTATATSPAHVASYSATSLPTGLSINTATGIISGTPTLSGTVSTTVTATDNLGSSSHITVLFTIATAPNYYYTGSGTLNDYHNWYTGSNGSGVQAPSGVFSQANTVFNILTNATTASDAGRWTVNGTNSYINVGSSTTNGVTLVSTNNNPILGIVNLPAALAGSNTLNAQDDTIPTLGTLNPSSTVVYGGSVAQIISTAAYGNLTISNNYTTGATTVAQSALTVAGTLTVTSGATLTLPSATTTSITVTGSVVISGTVIFPAGFTTYIGGAATFTATSSALIYVGSTAGIASTGNIRTTGTRSLSGGSYVFNASGAAVTGSYLTGCNNLTINNASGTTTLSAATAVTGTVTISAGTLACGTDLLILKSTSITNSATVASVLGSITGTATVERYIPKGFRGYRDMAPEVYGAGTIYSNWQNGGSYAAGSGIFVTGPTPYAGSVNAIDGNGFDKTATTSSTTQDYTFVNGAWTALSNTNSTSLDAFTGYRLLIRGDRTPNLYTSNVTNTQSGLEMFNATTLKATGNLIYGTVTYNSTTSSGVTGTVNGGSAGAKLSSVALNTSTDTSFSLIANPYVSPVSWTAVYAASGGASSSGINGSYWYLDPTSGAAGKYIAYNALTGSPTLYSAYYSNGTYSSTGIVTGTDYIQPGQALFVQNKNSLSPKVVFTEACKVSSANLKDIFGTSTLSKLYVTLFKQASGATTYSSVDGAAVAFRSDFGNTVYGPQDALKLAGATDNLSISDKGKNLSIDGRLPAIASDVIELKIASPSATNYQLGIDASKYVSNGFVPVLVDALKNTTTKLGSGVTTLNFTVDATNTSTYQNRFTILFTPSALPVNSIVASASLNNKVATITWNTVGEKGVARYEVEKSTDAKTFATIGQSTAKNTATASYATTDNSVTATSYYRIKAVSTTGAVSYSNVAKLTNDNSQLTSYSLYPNPLKGKILNVALDNVVAGKYTVSIYNALGQKVNEQTISHTGGSATHAISINNALAAGVYNVIISEAGSKQLVHQSTLSIQP